MALAADLLEYPDDDFLATAERLGRALRQAECDAGRDALLSFIDWISQTDPLRAREDYVAIFDHDPAASLHMAWHRYGNDRGQGRAMAALNGLYRTAGYEPVNSGAMPDYLPRMLEFMSAAEDWAVEAMLDGFGPEIDGLTTRLKELKTPYAELLEAVVAPLRRKYPGHLSPRSKPDPTIRPMARPAPEEVPVELARRTGEIAGREGG
ncbi:MAG: nitrate reductase molybdenum cofactor assembly chaperone [Desulfovibrio sp.]|nr:nitrate reductase molybdenum cofactor assembly chaperone [Desulfovibrio sp.]